VIARDTGWVVQRDEGVGWKLQAVIEMVEYDPDDSMRILGIRFQQWSFLVEESWLGERVGTVSEQIIFRYLFLVRSCLSSKWQCWNASWPIRKIALSARIDYQKTKT